MSNSLQIAKLRTGTIYKLVLVGLVFGFVPLFILFGVLGALDLMTLSWNGQAVTGPKAIVVGPLMGLLFSLVFTAVLGSVMAFGLWLFGKFRPLTIDFLPAEEAG